MLVYSDWSVRHYNTNIVINHYKTCSSRNTEANSKQHGFCIIDLILFRGDILWGYNFAGMLLAIDYVHQENIVNRYQVKSKSKIGQSKVKTRTRSM